MSYLELISVNGVKYRLSSFFFFFCIDVYLCQNHLLKGLFFLFSNESLRGKAFLVNLSSFPWQSNFALYSWQVLLRREFPSLIFCAIAMLCTCVINHVIFLYFCFRRSYKWLKITQNFYMHLHSSISGILHFFL